MFRDESAHMELAFEAVRTIRREEPGLFDADMTRAVSAMFQEAIDCETQFTQDLLGSGVPGLSNFFEWRVSAYQVGVEGDVVLDAAF